MHWIARQPLWRVVLVGAIWPIGLLAYGLWPLGAMWLDGARPFSYSVDVENWSGLVLVLAGPLIVALGTWALARWFGQTGRRL